MNCDTVSVIVTTTTTDAKTTPLVLYPREAGDIDVTMDPDGIGASSIAADSIGASEIAANAIGASEIAADAIGASELATDAIGASELAASAVDEILDDTVDGTKTLREILCAISATQLGKSNGQGTSTVTFRNIDDDANVVVGTMDASFNRTAVTLTLGGCG